MSHCRVFCRQNAIMRASALFILRVCIGTFVVLLGTAQAKATVRRFAVIVANNHSLDKNVQSLSFADNDGAKYYELFTALGMDTQLFAVLDADVQARFPEATKASRAPTHSNIMDGVDAAFARMGKASGTNETEFYFVYSGHGDVGANREGYLNFLDQKFRRRDLYHDIIARSPASWNHIILDACNAYFVVNKRGGGSDRVGSYGNAVKQFMATEELRSYPNTGIILAASSESETHEWSRWKSGIFSHELRSALLGAADINADGKISYAEAAASIEAANAEIKDPSARLRVFAHPPAQNIDRPLANLWPIWSRNSLRFEHRRDGSMREHVYIEDSRGVRMADLHPSGEQPVVIGLIGKAPYYIRTATKESMVGMGHWSTAKMPFKTRGVASRGSLDQTFRKQLYGLGFGPQFYRGFIALRGSDWDGWYGTAGAASPKIKTMIITGNENSGTALTPIGWTALGASSAALTAALLYTSLAAESRGNYANAGEPSSANKFKVETNQRAQTANILYGVAGGLAALGTSFIVWDLFHKDDKGAATALHVYPTRKGSVFVTIEGSFF